jgi:hypothetical protein
MGILDFLTGGNPKVAAKSTIDIFNDELSYYGDLESAYRYTYIFRFNTIVKYVKHNRDYYVVDLFRQGKIINCTYITVANLNTGAAPNEVFFEQTYTDFHKGISENLRKFGMPEKYIAGDNKDSVTHMLKYLKGNERVPSEMYDSLVEHK